MVLLKIILLKSNHPFAFESSNNVHCTYSLSWCLSMIIFFLVNIALYLLEENDTTPLADMSWIYSLSSSIPIITILPSLDINILDFNPDTAFMILSKHNFDSFIFE